MTLPAGPSHCQCRHALDVLGDHRTSFPSAGILRTRGGPLERAIARICREAGGRVASNVRLVQMNLDLPVDDDRNIEVVANGLPLWHGAQVAVDATLVCPVGRDGLPRRNGDIVPGQALIDATATKHDTYQDSFLPDGVALSSLALKLAAAGVTKPWTLCANWQDAEPKQNRRG